ASPEAGWRLNPALCPDLREDRRDRAVTTGRRDLREDRRVRRYVNCPARAWTYVGPRSSKARIIAPAYTSIYVGRDGYYYGIRDRRTVRIVTIR
ncbi:MAG: hypothetical protein AAGA69_04500, partial [Pseudomonadota bacterium]